MKIIVLNPEVIEVPDTTEIPAGMITVLPNRVISNLIENEDGNLPDGMIVCAGQNLNRQVYPELSGIYTHTGGFYEFTVPDLENKVMCGVDLDGDVVKGSGLIYYKTFPEI